MRNTISDLSEAGPGMENEELMELMDQNEEMRIAQEQANEYSKKLEDWVRKNDNLARKYGKKYNMKS